MVGSTGFTGTPLSTEREILKVGIVVSCTVSYGTVLLRRDMWSVKVLFFGTVTGKEEKHLGSFRLFGTGVISAPGSLLPTLDL